MMKKTIEFDNEKLILIKKDIDEFAKREKIIFNMTYTQCERRNIRTNRNEVVSIRYGELNFSNETSYYDRETEFIEWLEEKYNMDFYFDYRGLEENQINNFIDISYETSLNFA